MKKNYVQLIIAILFTTNVMAQNVPNYLPTNGLVGWWPFNGNANDESGNGNNGTVNGATLTADRNGTANSAYSFDGKTSFISTPNISSLNGTSQFSMSAWVKVLGFNSNTNCNLGCAQYIISRANDVTNGAFQLAIVQGTYYNFYSNINSFGTYSPSPTQIPQTNWHFAVVTYNGSNVKLYVDNILVKTLSYSTPLGNSTAEILFGKHINTSYPYFVNGLIDDIAIYNRALTQEEITALYSTKSCTDPIASITPQSTTTFCEGGSVNLNASTGENYTYEWYNNGNIINGETTSVYTATTFGNYTVKVIDGECNTTSSATLVSVNQYPSSIVQTSGNTTFCQGNSITLTAQGNGSYLWSTGTTSKSITVNQTGDYSLTITSNGCSSTSNNTAITVNPLPTASIIPQGNTTFCQGGFVNLVANGGTSYQWNTGSSATSISANQSGTFTVNAFNSFGCQASANQTVTVNANPSVSLNSLNAYTLKTSSPIQLVGNPTGGSYGGEGVAGSTFNPATVSLGKKTITYNYTSPQGCSGSASKTIIVADTVGNVCSVTKYDTVTIKNNVYDTVKINKTIFDTVLVNKTIYDTLVVKNNVYDTITMTDTVSILKIKIKLTTGIYANQITSMSLYPNPTSDVLHIEVGDVTGLAGYRYRIVDALGKEVYNELVKNAITEIPLKTLGAAGIYQLEVLDQKSIRIQTNKIVLQ